MKCRPGTNNHERCRVTRSVFVSTLPLRHACALGLLASGTVCELRELHWRTPLELLHASPKGTVPVLVPTAQGAGQSLTSCYGHCGAATRRDGCPHLYGAGSGACTIPQCDGDFKRHLDRYKYPNRHALPDGLQHRALGSGYLSQLDRLLQTQGHLAGPAWGLADAAIAPFVRQWAHTDPPWFASQPWPALQPWLSAFENSAEFAKAMVKLPPWHLGALAVQFGSH